MAKYFKIFVSSLGLMFTLACSKSWELTNGTIESSSHDQKIFRKGEILNSEEQMALEINQREAPEFDLSVQQAAPVVQNKDPLIVQITRNQTLQLSSPFSGVLFDIFGDNFNAGKFTVSWPVGEDFGFLVLPDQNNQVNSVHEMFGDGSIGPDGLAAINGYDALEKYDGLLNNGLYSLAQRNKIIDNNDSIFPKLRIWVDRNRNGHSESSELSTLDSVGIRSLSLKYDSKFYERDEFGNIIAFKSTIIHRDGSERRMFNLWLRYINL